MRGTCRLFPACRGAAVYGHIQTSLPANPAHGTSLETSVGRYALPGALSQLPADQSQAALPPSMPQVAQTLCHAGRCWTPAVVPSVLPLTLSSIKQHISAVCMAD